MDKKNDKKKKKITIAVALVIAILACAITVIAWFYNQRVLKTSASLISPYTLRIGAGSNESIEQLDMGNIDVSTAPGSKDYVICVYGNPSVPYVMQLAHTTNIGFTYSVYYAGEPSNIKPESGEVAEYTDMKGNPHYFSVVAGNTVRKMTGDTTNTTLLMDKSNYINNNNGIANDSLKVKETSGKDVVKGSYDQKDKVQKNASALYMQSDIIYPTEQEDNYGEFVHYYIVRVSWDANIKNDKETDIVYITVSAE